MISPTLSLFDRAEKESRAMISARRSRLSIWQVPKFWEADIHHKHHVQLRVS